MVNEIIVAFLGTLLLMNHSESKPVTPSARTVRAFDNNAGAGPVHPARGGIR